MEVVPLEFGAGAGAVAEAWASDVAHSWSHS